MTSRNQHRTKARVGRPPGRSAPGEGYLGREARRGRIAIVVPLALQDAWRDLTAEQRAEGARQLEEAARTYLRDTTGHTPE